MRIFSFTPLSFNVFVFYNKAKQIMCVNVFFPKNYYK